MAQQGQMLKLKTRGGDGKPLWAYRYRVDGRGSARPQVGGFASQGEALEALKVALERLHRRNGRAAQITLSELAEEYLAQHEAAPRTLAKLRWLLAKATGAFRRPARRRASIGRDRRVAKDAARRTPLRGHPGIAPNPEPRGRLEDHRLEPGQGRCRQPAPATQGEAAVRVVDGDQRSRRAPPPDLGADDRLPGRNRRAHR